MKGMSLRTKLPMALRGSLGVIRRPKYMVAALVFALFFALLIYFIMNVGIYGSFLLSPLPITGKLQAMGLMVSAMARDITTTTNGALLLIVALLQGVNFAFLLFTIRRNKKMNVRDVGGGGFAAIAAAMGLGCVPCGTSIILPIVSIFFSSSAYAAANVASAVVLIAAFVVSLYSIYRLGFVAYAYAASDEITKSEGE